MDRGYTGHEHLQSVGLIHMNGRLYDPKLHRFLQTDNYVQDPGNTQNYNSYGYVLNNPLKYTDPSGWLTQAEEKEKAQKAEEDRRKAGKSMLDWLGGLFDSIGSALGITTEPTMQGGILDEVVIHGKARSAQSGGGIDFSNTSIVLDIGGAIYGGLQGLTSSQGMRLGKNGQYKSTSWGGNQYTGSRSGALKAASNYKLAGRATVVVSVLIGIYNTRVGYQEDGGKFGYNAEMAAASSAGSIVGGMAGAEAGALIGAGIGAWFGGVGAIPGAVIGGVIGGFGLGMGGGYYGGQLGGSAVNYYYDR